MGTANWMTLLYLSAHFGTWLVEAGTHPKVIQSMMDHDTPKANEISKKSVPDLKVKAMGNLARSWGDE